ncbi:hypothetical protein SCLARK_001187 [Spiroplasma clarkii]|nr:hypothetical protein SCLARK_001187 [Spiroplasma clarkii]
MSLTVWTILLVILSVILLASIFLVIKLVNWLSESGGKNMLDKIIKNTCSVALGLLALASVLVAVIINLR